MLILQTFKLILRKMESKVHQNVKKIPGLLFIGCQLSMEMGENLKTQKVGPLMENIYGQIQLQLEAAKVSDVSIWPSHNSTKATKQPLNARANTRTEVPDIFHQPLVQWKFLEMLISLLRWKCKNVVSNHIPQERAKW